MEYVAGIIFIVGLIALFTIPIGMFNVKMFKGSNGTNPGGAELLKAYLPFVNIRYARVMAYGTSPVYLGLLILCGVFLLLRAISYALVAAGIGFGVYLAFFSAFTSLAAIAIWWVLAAVNGIDFGNMLNVGVPTKLCCIILPPLGYYMLSNIVMPYFKSEEVTADATFGAQN